MKKIIAAFLIFLGSLIFSLEIPDTFDPIERFDYRTALIKTDLIQIQHPQFLFKAKHIKVLNATVMNIIEDMWENGKGDLVSHIKKGFRNRTNCALSFKIRKIDNRIVSVTFENYALLGGVHGISPMKALNFDPVMGKVLKLEDLFYDGVDYVFQINTFVKECFKNVHTITEFKTTSEDQGFFLTDFGLTVFFQRYEHTPYALGYPIVFIPYGELEEFKTEYLCKRWLP